MQCTLDDIVTIAQVVSGISVTDENRSKYISFLQRQIDKQGYILEDKTDKLDQRLHEYRGGNVKIRFTQGALRGVTSVNYMLADALAIFSYLIRETPVEESDSGKITTLRSAEDLHLLRQGSSRDDFPSDAISKIYIRRLNQKKANPELMNYQEIINEIGKDPEVVRVWGRELRYEVDIKSSQHGARRHGGDATPISEKWRP